MFDQFRLKDVLVAYKQNFVAKQWGDEKYKWEAVKWFQDNWDVNAPDFAEMLNRSLDKTFNLLASNNNFPKGMIVGFAKSAPEEVRAMFIALFDESKDVFERMDAFKMQSSILLEKYGNGAAQHYQYENAISTYLWLRYPDKYYIYKFGEVKTVATGVNPNTRDDGTTQWWTILYTGRDAGKDEDGSFIWKLRDELSAALDKADLSGIELYVAAAPGEQDRGYWWLNANPKIWSFADIAVGEVQSYTLYNENGNKRRIFQNFLDAKAGDMIIGYESNPVKQIVAIGRVSAEQDGEKLFFEKVEGLTSPIDYATLKGCPELERMEYFQNPQGSLFKLTRGEYDFILDMIREENPVATEASIDAYTKSDFLDEVYMTEKRYENLVAVLRNKKNIILQGAPGVGKTFAARRLA